MGWFTGGREYFNATLGKCRVVTQPDRISLITSQSVFDGVQTILL